MGGAWEAEEDIYRVLSRQAEGKRPLSVPQIILTQISKKQAGREWIG